MSYIQPEKKNHLATTLILILAGLIGTGILSANRIRSEASHKKELDGLGSQIREVAKQNGALSDFLLRAKGSGVISEADRRRGILTTLRNEYILSHQVIDPEILAGNRMPPDEWLEKRLHELGENWDVRESRILPLPEIVREVSPPAQKAEVLFSFYDPTITSNFTITHTTAFIQEKKIKISVPAIATGDVTANDLIIWLRVCKGCSWVSIPTGFSAAPNLPSDVEIQISKLPPNVMAGKWDLDIKVNNMSTAISAYYSCSNCPTVDWDHPQILWVNQQNPFVLPKIEK